MLAHATAAVAPIRPGDSASYCSSSAATPLTACVRRSYSDHAIRQLEAHLDITVVFSDIDMPRGSMDGLKLIHAVRNRWPPVILILASGRASPLVADMPPETIFLRKPYSEEPLLKAIAA